MMIYEINYEFLQTYLENANSHLYPPIQVSASPLSMYFDEKTSHSKIINDKCI